MGFWASPSAASFGLDDRERKEQYARDVTYATNNELGFDYLRDNMKFTLEEMVSDFNFAIVDEVDSILIDEARTPLIISGPTDDTSELYIAVNKLMPRFDAGDYEKDEKSRAVAFTEVGTEKLENLCRDAGLLSEGGLYDLQNVAIVHHANQALKAHTLFAKDVDYVVKDGKVVIIDEFTGRMMEGRRYSDGLHQALEAKERVPIQNENQTLASITFQNYFRLYPKLAGMTGTAMTEAGEFAEIYGLDVVEIPTNVPVRRVDNDDRVYRTEQEKHEAIVGLIREAQERGQPVLVGTVSIEKSESLSASLEKAGIGHEVLNARKHDREALIIAQAGQPGTVTIATNMAGRGTDIQLGGNPDMRIARECPSPEDPKAEKIRVECAEAKERVKESGGLFIIGTERHESRRIDNQLRGRAGRQGDRGESIFFLSLEDDLMRIFGSDRIDGMLRKLGLEEGEAITHVWVNKALEKAQQKVEARNFEIRKNLLKFDNVMNDQRKAIYDQRKELMASADVSATVRDMREEVVIDMVNRHIPEKAYPEQWNMDGLHEEVLRILGKDLPVRDWAGEEGIADREIQNRLLALANNIMREKEERCGANLTRDVEKGLLLQVLDQVWKEHLLALDHLRQGIGLRAYGQRDPLNEYKAEAFAMFEAMLATLRERTTAILAHIQIQTDDEVDLFRPRERVTHESRSDPTFKDMGDENEQTGHRPVTRRKVEGDIDPTPTRQPGAACRATLPAPWRERPAVVPAGPARNISTVTGNFRFSLFPAEWSVSPRPPMEERPAVVDASLARPA